MLKSDKYGKASSFVMLLVTLLRLASMVLGEVVMPSPSSPSWREFNYKLLSPTSK